MGIFDALFSLMDGDAGLTALVASRIYPDVAPSQVGKPYIVYQRISTHREVVQELTPGDTTLSRPRFQITAIAADKPGVISIAEALRDLLHGYKGTEESVVIGQIRMANERDNFYDAISEYTIQQDYLIWYQET